MRVLKFGGTSLANSSRIAGVSRLVLAAAEERWVVVVASAMAGVTNILETMTQQAGDTDVDWTPELDSLEFRHLEVLSGLPASYREPAAAAVCSRIRKLRADVEALTEGPLDRPEICDRILAVGERLAVVLLAANLQEMGCAARPVDGADVVVTDSTFGEARVDFVQTENRCRRLLESGGAAIPIVTGFVGGDSRGRTTTLGRGGSDYSAAVLGAVLGAERVEIWTDVDGVLTGPPSRVPKASSVLHLSYEEAEELSFFGAEVLHPKTVRPLAQRGIPITVRSTLAPARRGTEISDGSREVGRVVAVSAVEDVTVLRLQTGIVGCLDEILMSCRASCDGATLVAVPTPKVERLISKLAPHGDPPVQHRFPASVITLVGHEIAERPWVAGRALESLAGRGIATRGFTAGATPHTVAVLVDRIDLEASLRTIHDALMLDRENANPNHTEAWFERSEVGNITAA